MSNTAHSERNAEAVAIIVNNTISIRRGQSHVRARMFKEAAIMHHLIVDAKTVALIIRDRTQSSTPSHS